MSYNIAGLPAYTSQQSKEFITRSILGAATIALLTQFGAFDPTAKGSEAVNLLDSDITIQDGSDCGRNPMGGAVLSQAILTVKPLKINQDYCVKELEKTWAVEELKRVMKGLPYTDALFMEDIARINSDKTALEIEKIIWNGDTTSANTSLKQFNGFLKQLTTAGNTIDLNPGNLVWDGTNTIAILRAASKAMPIEIKMKDDFRILIGMDMEEAYVAELADKNLFLPPSDVKTLFGTTSKFIAVPGLNGTGKIVAAQVSHLRAGGEMTEAKFEKMFSVETKKTYLDSEFSLGVVPVLTDEIGVGDYNA